jgi:hypothetical protein
MLVITDIPETWSNITSMEAASNSLTSQYQYKGHKKFLGGSVLVLFCKDSRMLGFSV